MSNYPTYFEFNCVGKYLAFIRHQIITENWMQLTKRKQPFFSFESPIYYEDKNVFNSNVSNIALVSDLDRTVFGFVEGAPVYDLIKSIEKYEKLIKSYWEGNTPLKLFKKSSFKKWNDYIKGILTEFKHMPEIIINNHLRSYLHYIYNEMYENMTRLVGIDYFLERLGWNKKQFIEKRSIDEVPPPALVIESKSIWTIGQVETFYYIHNNLDIQEIFQTFPLPQEFGIYRTFDELYNNRKEYSFYNDRYYYYARDIAELEEEKINFSQANAIKNFITSKIKNPPELYWTMGRKYLLNDDFKNAKENLQKAKDIYFSVIPVDFDGEISYENNPEFFFTLLDLAFISARKENVNSARDLIEKANYMSGPDLDLSTFVNDIKEILNWYQQNLKLNA